MLKVLPTGIVQEMRCAGSLSLQAWGRRDQPRLGMVKRSMFRFSVVQAGGQWLTGRTHMKEHGKDGKNKSMKKCIASPFCMSKHSVQVQSPRKT